MIGFCTENALPSVQSSHILEARSGLRKRRIEEYGPILSPPQTIPARYPFLEVTIAQHHDGSVGSEAGVYLDLSCWGA